MTTGERRYFRILGVVGSLSLLTIGSSAAMEHFDGPPNELFSFLAHRAFAPADEPEPQPALELEADLVPPLSLDEGLADWPLADEAPPPCVMALESTGHSSRWVPELALDPAELGCRLRFD